MTLLGTTINSKLRIAADGGSSDGMRVETDQPTGGSGKEVKKDKRKKQRVGRGRDERKWERENGKSTNKKSENCHLHTHKPVATTEPDQKACV